MPLASVVSGARGLVWHGRLIRERVGWVAAVAQGSKRVVWCAAWAARPGVSMVLDLRCQGGEGVRWSGQLGRSAVVRGVGGLWVFAGVGVSWWVVEVFAGSGYRGFRWGLGIVAFAGVWVSWWVFEVFAGCGYRGFRWVWVSWLSLGSGYRGGLSRFSLSLGIVAFAGVWVSCWAGQGR